MASVISTYSNPMSISHYLLLKAHLSKVKPWWKLIKLDSGTLNVLWKIKAILLTNLKGFLYFVNFSKKLIWSKNIFNLSIFIKFHRVDELYWNSTQIFIIALVSWQPSQDQTPRWVQWPLQTLSILDNYPWNRMNQLFERWNQIVIKKQTREMYPSDLKGHRNQNNWVPTEKCQFWSTILIVIF